MAHYEYDEEPLRFYRAATRTPGRVSVNVKVFYTLCVFAGVGAFTLLMILAGV